MATKVTNTPFTYRTLQDNLISLGSLADRDKKLVISGDKIEVGPASGIIRTTLNVFNSFVAKYISTDWIAPDRTVEPLPNIIEKMSCFIHQYVQSSLYQPQEISESAQPSAISEVQQSVPTQLPQEISESAQPPAISEVQQSEILSPQTAEEISEVAHPILRFRHPQDTSLAERNISSVDKDVESSSATPRWEWLKISKYFSSSKEKIPNRYLPESEEMTDFNRQDDVQCLSLSEMQRSIQSSALPEIQQSENLTTQTSQQSQSFICSTTTKQPSSIKEIKYLSKLIEKAIVGLTYLRAEYPHLSPKYQIVQRQKDILKENKKFVDRSLKSLQRRETTTV